MDSVLVRTDQPRLVFYSVFRRWIEPGAIIARSSRDHRAIIARSSHGRTRSKSVRPLGFLRLPHHWQFGHGSFACFGAAGLRHSIDSPTHDANSGKQLQSTMIFSHGPHSGVVVEG